MVVAIEGENQSQQSLDVNFMWLLLDLLKKSSLQLYFFAKVFGCHFYNHDVGDIEKSYKLSAFQFLLVGVGVVLVCFIR